MSIFKSEAPNLSKVILDQSAASVNLQEGEIWNDNVQLSLQARTNGQQFAIQGVYPPNITPVTNTNPTAATALMTQAIKAGALNVVGKYLYISGAGLYTTAAAQTPTITIAVTLGAVTLATWTSAATTASSTNFPWNFDLFLITQTKGSSGLLESHGIFNVTLGAAAAGAETSYNDVNTSTVGPIDLTAAQTLSVTGLFSTGNAGNSQSQRLLVIEQAN